MLVSCLFDLGTGRERSLEHYVALGRSFLLQQPDLPVLVFCDPNLVKRLSSISSTAVILPYDISQHDPELAAIEQNIRLGQCNKDRNKKKDTAAYHLIGWLKPHFLKLASETCPNYSHYCWIDFGINHVAITSHWPQALRQEKWSDSKIQVLCINPPRPIANLMHYVSQRQYKIGGGFWIVPRSLVASFSQKFEQIRTELTKHFATLEDELLGILCSREPQLFTYHYGDYQDILHLDYPRHQASHRLLARNILNKETPLEAAVDMYRALTANCQLRAALKDALCLQLNQRLVGTMVRVT